jgi:hypothetical protein
VQVWSVDSDGRTDICGYGFMNFPTTPGMYEIECPTWVPEGTACVLPCLYLVLASFSLWLGFGARAFVDAVAVR